MLISFIINKPDTGIKPATSALPMRRSINWANQAQSYPPTLFYNFIDTPKTRERIAQHSIPNSKPQPLTKISPDQNLINLPSTNP